MGREIEGGDILLMACEIPPRPALWDNKIKRYFSGAIGASSLVSVPQKMHFRQV